MHARLAISLLLRRNLYAAVHFLRWRTGTHILLFLSAAVYSLADEA